MYVILFYDKIIFFYCFIINIYYKNKNIKNYQFQINPPLVAIFKIYIGYDIFFFTSICKIYLWIKNIATNGGLIIRNFPQDKQ